MLFFCTVLLANGFTPALARCLRASRDAVRILKISVISARICFLCCPSFFSSPVLSCLLSFFLPVLPFLSLPYLSDNRGPKLTPPIPGETHAGEKSEASEECTYPKSDVQGSYPPQPYSHCYCLRLSKARDDAFALVYEAVPGDHPFHRLMSCLQCDCKRDNPIASEKKFNREEM